MNSARRKGSVIPLVAIYMVMFAAVATLAVDYGHVQLVKTELQRAADATARGYADYYASKGQSYANAHAAALYSSANNPVDGPAPTTTVTWGYWTPSTSTFSTSSGTLTAVKIQLSCTAANKNAVPLFWGGLLNLVSTNVHATAVACATTAALPFAGLNSIAMSGNAQFDSYNSSLGTYNNQTRTSNAIVQSNGTIAMSGNAIVNGNANPGIGDSVTTSGNARVTGSTTPVKSALSYPAPTAPGNAPTATGNATTAPGNATSLGNFSISGNTNQTLTAGVYSCTGLSVTGNATLTISGAVTIYVNGSVSLSGNSVVTQNLPSNFSIQVTSSGSVTLSGNGELDADIYAPLADVAISGNGNFCGVIVAKTMAISGNGLLHYDLAGGGGTSVITLAQ